MDRNATPIGHHNALNVAEAVDHALRTNVISPIDFLNVATACILVVATQGLKQFPNGDVERA